MAEEIEQPKSGNKYPIVKASFDLEANRRNYQALLQNLAGIQVTKDNVNDDLTKDAREVLKMLTEKKDNESKEPLQWHKDIMAVFKSLASPLEQEILRIAGEKKIISEGLRRDAQIQLAEQKRIADAKTAIVDFINKVANMIKVAKDDKDIVSIEKMIGSEKTKSTVYQEFLSDLVIQCDGLRPQIKDQKENIRQLQTIEKKEQEALQTGDIVAATQLKEEKEQIQAVIEETGIRIHEKAFDQATTIDIIAPEVVETAPKGRTSWKWEVQDIKLLQKKMPHLVKLIPDEEAINQLLATKRNDGSLKNKEEEKFFGIRFYNDRKFK